MSNDTISQILMIILGIMLFILVILITIFLILRTKEKIKKNSSNNYDLITNQKNKKNVTKQSVDMSYSKESIMNFMEFDKIEDNMIVQKKGKRFLMVIECQGVNYDLMSKMEKVSVEEGFQQKQ